MSTKPIIVEVTSQKSAESKPILKKSADKAASEVKAVIIKEKVNSKKDGRVKSIVGKFEQNQVAKSKATPATQADMGVLNKLCQIAFLVQLNFQSVGKEDVKLRYS